MSRLAAAFHASHGQTGLIPYLTAGYPTTGATLEMMRGLASAGVLALELGVPFSDPIADGPDIQRASEWAVRGGVGVPQVLDLAGALRRESDLPLIVMTYTNPVLRFGAERFAGEAGEAGVDAVIVSDLPPEESPELWEAFDRAGLDTVMLIAPTTPPGRMAGILGRCRGFAYCLARTGVTGRAGGYAGSLPERVADLRLRTHLPIAVGFGISSPADARALRGLVDAVVVGAAFMRTVTEDPASQAVARVLGFADDLIEALA